MNPSRTSPGPVDAGRSPHAVLYPLPFEALRLGDGFWNARQELNHNVTLRHGYTMLDQHGHLDNFRIAGGIKQGSYRGYQFLDSDAYKWLEAMAWELGRRPDTGLQALADEVITLVARAQQPDGYLNTHFQLVRPGERFQDLELGHELYCAGHLFQAAVAFQRAQGDGRLLGVARHLADHLCGIFGPGKLEGVPGHPEVEMALVELYRATGEQRYLALAQFFIDQRGQGRLQGLPGMGPEYFQDHLPLRRASEAAGHAVRQLYLASGATDLYLESGEAALLEAVQRLWDSVTGSKLYLTGGVGSVQSTEGFGQPYDLPPEHTHCETCAAIASVMWSWRMLLATGEARFADLIERTLYNNILSGLALDGAHFLYTNPLMLRDPSRVLSTWQFAGVDGLRPEWYDCACCPPNLMRLLASLDHYFATWSPSGVQIHQYGPAELCAPLAGGGEACLNMESNYPWGGTVLITVRQAGGTPWALDLRPPSWAGASPQPIRITLNGQGVSPPRMENGYLRLERAWQPGDTVELELPVEPRLVAPNPRLDAVRGCLAIQRGPLVYCLEAQDQPDGAGLLDLAIDPAGSLSSRWAGDELGGAMLVEAAGFYLDPSTWGRDLYRPLEAQPQHFARPVTLTAIPYYAWANRGLDAMRVWIPAALNSH